MRASLVGPCTARQMEEVVVEATAQSAAAGLRAEPSAQEAVTRYAPSTSRLINIGRKMPTAATLAQEKSSVSTFRLAQWSLEFASRVLSIGTCARQSSPPP